MEARRQWGVEFPAAAAVYGNAQVAASGGMASSGYRSGVTTIYENHDRYNRYTEQAAAHAGHSKSSQAYTYILTKLEKRTSGSSA